MKKRTYFVALLISLLAFLAGCATLQTAGHKYVMKGQVLEVSDGSAYLCTGTAEGAKSGDVYTVYRYTKVLSARPQYLRDAVGKVRVEELVDEHYATAKILSGQVKEHDVVELD